MRIHSMEGRKVVALSSAGSRGESKAKQRGGGERCRSSHMIPCRPVGDVECPSIGAARAVRGKRCKRLVLGHVEYDRYQEATNQVECTANNEINGVWHLPPKYRADHGDRTQYGHSMVPLCDGLRRLMGLKRPPICRSGSIRAGEGCPRRGSQLLPVLCRS